MNNRISRWIDGLCLIVMLGTVIYLFLSWGQVGAVSGGGVGLGRDGAASKQTLVILVVVTWFLFAGLTMAEQVPRLFTKEKELGDATRHVIRELLTMVRGMKLALVTLFSYLAVYSARVHELPEFLMPLTLGITVLSLILNLIRLNWMRKKA